MTITLGTLSRLSTERSVGRSPWTPIAEGWRKRMAAGVASVWHELHRELRRQAGNERLPSDLRGRLRGAAQRSHERELRAGQRTGGSRFPRRQVRLGGAIALPPPDPQVQRFLQDAGLERERRFVALAVRSRVEAFFEAVDYLVAQDYDVVRFGDAAAGAMRRRGVIDLACMPHDPAADVAVLAGCRFLVCEDPGLQRAGYATNTPTLLLNARDVFEAYPVREHGLFTMSTPIDLDTGAVLDLGDRLSERFYRNLRNIGFRDNTPAEIAAAVVEIEEGVRRGWREQAAQARFRSRVTEAGVVLAARVPHVAIWGPDAAFLGDGRIARVQADQP